VLGVRLTKRAVLLQLQFVRDGALIFGGGVVALLTVLTSKGYVISHNILC